ncbi:hypothetical protein [uncultured Marinobacter sp.]|uniref:hypothetical protein n=1 Tax=uncultured Marinobacter sp. TaxID=187379 RepID=UPI00260704C2|nr:hypothetical protein [uncultured Marinobacter sp.]
MRSEAAIENFQPDAVSLVLLLGVGALIALMLGLLIPLSLAIGNIYRTTHWPRGASPEQLAPGMLLGGAILILAVIYRNALHPPS